MALHNYIYTKHQIDPATDNKIARIHDPRPVSIKVDRELVEELADGVIHHHYHHHSAQTQSILLTYESPEVDEESSDSDLARKQLQHHRHPDHHHAPAPRQREQQTQTQEKQSKVNEEEQKNHSKNHHYGPGHSHHQQPIAKQQSIEVSADKALADKAAPRSSKWIVVGGERKKLKSRFRKKHTSTDPSAP